MSMLLNPRIKKERKRIAVAFADIRGFGYWSKRASNSPEESGPFETGTFREFFRIYVLKPYFTKTLGDGIMVIRELKNKPDRNCLISFFNDVFLLLRRMQYLIDNTEYPRPAGFRVRMVSGRVSKFTGTLNKITITDYMGNSLNLAERLLKVAPEINFICHQSIKEIWDVGASTADKDLFDFKRLEPPKDNPWHLDQSDLEELWVVQRAEEIKKSA